MGALMWLFGVRTIKLRQLHVRDIVVCCANNNIVGSEMVFVSSCVWEIMLMSAVRESVDLPLLLEDAA